MTYVRIYYIGGFLNNKYMYGERNGLWYELQGNYYIPCLILPAEKESYGLWDSANCSI